MLDWIKGGGNIPREGGIRRLEHCQKGGDSDSARIKGIF